MTFIIKLLLTKVMVVFFFVYTSSIGGCRGFINHHSGFRTADDFTNHWLVRVHGDPEIAQLLALEMGYKYGGEIPYFPEIYIFTKDSHAIKRRTPEIHLTKRLSQNSKVVWAEQLFTKKLVKRDFLYYDDHDQHFTNAHYKAPEFKTPVLGKSLPESEALGLLVNENKSSTAQDKLFASSVNNGDFNDELWDQQWYIKSVRTREDLPRLDLNVIPVYKMGYSGKGVKVSVVDDGIEYSHDDLKKNYDPSISWDVLNNDADPTPRYGFKNSDSHGTKCAGEIAMAANNSKCGVGIAFNANIGGIKFLHSNVNDMYEGIALGFAYDNVDIYSNSWGPDDNGQDVSGPDHLGQEALLRGIIKGRGGKGAIFVWANGNGGYHGDDCNCDGYVNSIYTVAVGSVTNKGTFPNFGEKCTATLAVTHSAESFKDQKIIATDLNNTCTTGFSGTSASAPLAAGILALALEANPKLTWRDVQHLTAWTSDLDPLDHEDGWIYNGAGLRYDTRFGFGLMNAHSMVKDAQKWKNVPEKIICEINSTSGDSEIFFDTTHETRFDTKECLRNGNMMKFLEHVQVKINIQYSVRGALEINLTSPQETLAPLLTRRPKDDSSAGFSDWKLMSMVTWGEDPEGIWLLQVSDTVGPITNYGSIGPTTLILHGTKEQPEYLKNGQRYKNPNPKKSNEQNIASNKIGNNNKQNNENEVKLPIKIKIKLPSEIGNNAPIMEDFDPKGLYKINDGVNDMSSSLNFVKDNYDAMRYLWNYLGMLYYSASRDEFNNEISYGSRAAANRNNEADVESGYNVRNRDTENVYHILARLRNNRRLNV